MKKINKTQEAVNNIKRSLGEFLNGGKCEICHTPWSKRGMTIHHITYKDEEKTHSDFGRDLKGKLEYYTYLEPIVRKEPERFSYLCNPHHQSITVLLRFAVDKQERMFDLVRRSR